MLGGGEAGLDAYKQLMYPHNLVFRIGLYRTIIIAFCLPAQAIPYHSLHTKAFWRAKFGNCVFLGNFLENRVPIHEVYLRPFSH